MLYPLKNDHYATSELCSFRPKSVKLRYARSASLQPVPCPLSPRKRTVEAERLSGVKINHSLEPSWGHRRVIKLAFTRRPTIGFGAGAAHQHRALTVAQAVSLEEGLDRLLVVDDGVCACPVRAPQATVETPGIEHASKRIPDVRERIWFPGQRAGATHLDHRILALGKVQHLRQVGPRLRRGGWRAGLQDSQMVDDKARIRVAIDQRRTRIHIAPAQDIDRKVALYGLAQDPVEAWVIRLALRLLRHNDADADRAGCLLPVGDDIADGWIVWVDRLDDREPTGMGALHFHRIARVVAVQGKGRDEDRSVDADLAHRHDHLVARNVIGPVRHTVPRSLRSVRFISVDLGIDNRHRGHTDVQVECRTQGV